MTIEVYLTQPVGEIISNPDNNGPVSGLLRIPNAVIYQFTDRWVVIRTIKGKYNIPEFNVRYIHELQE